MSKTEEKLDSIRQDSQPNCHLIRALLEEAEKKTKAENLDIARQYFSEEYDSESFGEYDEANLEYLARLEEEEYMGERDPVTKELMGVYFDSDG